MFDGFIFSAHPAQLIGYVAWGSASFTYPPSSPIGFGLSLTYFTMGTGKGNWDFPFSGVIGRDIGIDIMGGVSLPLSLWENPEIKK